MVLWSVSCAVSFAQNRFGVDLLVEEFRRLRRPCSAGTARPLLPSVPHLRLLPAPADPEVAEADLALGRTICLLHVDPTVP